MNFKQMLRFANTNPEVESFSFFTHYAFLGEQSGDATEPIEAVRVKFYMGGQTRAERDESLDAGGFCTFVRR
jgi:hypothetical protein